MLISVDLALDRAVLLLKQRSWEFHTVTYWESNPLIQKQKILQNLKWKYPACCIGLQKYGLPPPSDCLRVHTCLILFLGGKRDTPNLQEVEAQNTVLEARTHAFFFTWVLLTSHVTDKTLHLGTLVSPFVQWWSWKRCFSGFFQHPNSLSSLSQAIG